MRRILVTNDDGYFSPGLDALADALRPLGEVTVVAPQTEASAVGHALTLRRPLRLEKIRERVFAVDGTPTDCVNWGVLHLLKDERPKLLFSGINLGLNLGNSMWHSGTLAAAKQAALLGLRGIALSTPAGNSEPDFDRIDPYVHQVLECLLRHPDLPLVNVNFPRDPKGLRWARQSVRYYDGAVVPGEDPMGRKHFWLTVRALEGAEEGTDLWAVREGYVSLTPLRLDLTDHAELTRVVREIPLD